MVVERAELMSKINDMMAARVSDLKQKARSKWILDGDENSRYFYDIVNQRVKLSRIHGLTINGSWVSNPDVIKDEVFPFFKSKFEEKFLVRPILKSDLFNKITEAQKILLETLFNIQEIKNVVSSCGNNKHQARMALPSSSSEVKFFEANHLINPSSNTSFITLVLKVRDHLSLLRITVLFVTSALIKSVKLELRSTVILVSVRYVEPTKTHTINLIGCVSKVIGKVLAKRLKGVLDTVINDYQTAFIKGRSILDGPLMVNEVIAWAKRRRKKILLFKVDFAKAFDCLNWNFLDDVLRQIGFAWVKGVICSAKSSVLINGAPTKEFCFEKGVRQGDMLSPFLFILAAEGLSVAIREAQRNKLFKGVRFDDSEEDVSLLQYADDAIIMGEWEPENAKNLLMVLKCFELCSGLKISLEKRSLLGVSVKSEDVNRVARWLNCKVESTSFKYLGLPMGGKMAKIESWQRLIGKFRSRLSMRRGRLSKPLKAFEGGSFGSNNAEKISCKGWNKILRKKNTGGLGVGSLKAYNLAMSNKWCWRDRTEPNAKWRNVVTKCNAGNNSRNGGCGKGLKVVEKYLDELEINLNSLIKRNEDDHGWLESNQNFSIKSIRKVIDTALLRSADTKTFWTSWIPSKINVHIWRTLNDPLPTLENLEKCGVCLQSNQCKLCNSFSESSKHLFLDCSTTRIVSAHLSSWVDWWPTNVSSISGFWAVLDAHHRNGTQKKVIALIMAAFLWTMWMHRNNKMFKGIMRKEKYICSDIQFLAFQRIRCRTKYGDVIKWERWCYNLLDSLLTFINLAPC
ncbi:LOW QUALITY PROTEIN: hypothetical protein OSB04_023359 [Centaurea solstitialis]|uniref:Reverse transcriptase domain-containing protein n=1 Tax=Centaurea solstitialis TaxID=347529 RepID=A0AA38VZJ7_9ASTR|nr:LOW QUALITY PROTEIN: hypothetical protein OSB04_023359 [Centaurea solstitialis]